MSDGLKNVPQEAISFAKQHLKENDLLPPSLNKNNIRALKKCLNKLQISIEDVLKSTPKGYISVILPWIRKNSY